MPREKFTIESREDAFAAMTWLEAKMQHPYAFFPSTEFNFEERDGICAEFEKLNTLSDPAEVNAFCQAHLNAEQWAQLKNAIRAARHRRKSRGAKKSVDLKADAYWILAELAEHDGVTLSEVIKNRLGPTWEKMRRGLPPD